MRDIVDRLKLAIRERCEVPTSGVGERASEGDEPPESFLCPISCDVREDPMFVMNGNTYDRGSITAWWGLCGELQDPLTREILPSNQLITIRALKSEILEWKQRHGLP